jgi:hypothetical protein
MRIKLEYGQETTADWQLYKRRENVWSNAQMSYQKKSVLVSHVYSKLRRNSILAQRNEKQ